MGLDTDALLRFAHHLADLADAITLPAFRSGPAVETKADGTPVTAADRAVEAALRAAIRDAYPDHAVLGEEHGRDGAEDAPTWVIDPIDATRNFSRGIPVFATLIALLVEGAPVVGVVSAPALGSRWDGVAGGGARVDGRPIRVSDTRRLSDAHVSFGGLRYLLDRGLGDAVLTLGSRTARQRGFGDFWQHCLVASGGLDAAVEADVAVWDLAAVQVIVEAAGGRFTSFEGEATPWGGSAVASNGYLHDALLELLAGR